MGTYILTYTYLYVPIAITNRNYTQNFCLQTTQQRTTKREEEEMKKKYR